MTMSSSSSSSHGPARPASSSSTSSPPDADRGTYVHLAPAVQYQPKAASSRSRASSRDSFQINGSAQSSRLDTISPSSPSTLGLAPLSTSPHQARLNGPSPTVQTAFAGVSGYRTPSPATSPTPLSIGLAPPVLLSFTGPSTTNTPIASPTSSSSFTSGFRVLSRPAATGGPPPIGDPRKSYPSSKSSTSTAPSSQNSSRCASPLDPTTLPPSSFGAMSPLTLSMSTPSPGPSQPPPPSTSRRQGSNNSTPRRPSLLTQQILSSPAIPLATTFNSQANDHAPGMMGPPLIPEGAENDLKRGPSLKDKLMGHHSHSQGSNWGETSASGALRLDTSIGALSAGLGSAVAGTHSSATGASSILTHGMSTPQGVTRKGSLHRGRSYNTGSGSGGDGWRTPASVASSASGGQVLKVASGSTLSGGESNLAGLRSPTELDEDEVIETADLMFGKDHNTGRKMINQYLILQEIGRGQHGQVRLGQDLSSPESSRPGSSMGIHATLENAASGSQTTTHFPISAVTPFGEALHGAASPGNFWAIKIVDRQPRRKLPGMRKVGAPGVPEASVANEKLKREIAILKKCRHPNVVRLREVIDAPISKKIYLILEYCEGGEVKWKSDDGRPLLTVAEARRVFRDVVCGLEYLHHQGIIHRDIKPANLLYSGDGVVKISDFGVSHYSHVLRGNLEEGSGSPDEDEPAFVDEHDLAKTAGSPAFFAPELCYNGDGTPSGSNTPAAHQSDFNLQSGANMDSLNKRLSSLTSGSAMTTRPGSPMQRRKRPPITQAIDIWALGVTLYCFLFGRVPFDSTSEYALFSIIPVEDFAIPETMGADNMYTGGRMAFKQGPKNGLIEEACEVIDLIEKLLTKDPTKRITLEAVKRHPFTLRDITDKPAWLASTDLKTESYVTVSNDEVAAAVTNSGSFFKSVKRSVKHLSNKLNIFGSTGSKSRSRSQSIVAGNAPVLNEFGQINTAPDSTPSSATGTLNQIPSPAIRSNGRLPSNASANASLGRRPSSDSTLFAAESSSTRGVSGGPPQVTRRMSWLQSNSARPVIDRNRSPVAGHPAVGQSHVQGILPSSSEGSEFLGRSISDKSTGSSSGGPPAAPRAQPSRRQSTHLVPPRLGSPRLAGRALSSSASAEALDTMIANALVVEEGAPLSARAIKLRNKQSANMDPTAHLTVASADSRDNRPRSESNTSSAGGLNRIARLFSRNQSQKSNSTSGSYISTGRRSHERLRDAGKNPLELPVESQRSLEQELEAAEATSVTSAEPLRHRKSAETVASSLYDSSRADLSSPEVSKTRLPPLGITDWDGRQAFGMSPERPNLSRHSTEVPTRSIDAPDWNGNLSDDDDDEEDYGREAVSAYDRVPNSIDDLQMGNWKLDSRGWRGQAVSSEQAPPREALGLSVAPLPVESSAFSPIINLADRAETSSSDSPATLTGPPRVWNTPESPQTSPLSSSFEPNVNRSPPASPIHAFHPEFRNRSLSRNSMRGSPLRHPDGHGGLERAKSPLGRNFQELPPSRFMDAVEIDEDGEDAEEDGLAMDFGKRGRRFSKAASSVGGRKMSFGS